MSGFFPDGTAIDPWFEQADRPRPEAPGRRWVLSDFGILPDGQLHTARIQALIDRIAAEGGGVLTVPAGVYRTGALFFRPGVHLCVEAGGVLLGSDDIADYPLVDTRIEGESCRYFSALINADHCDGLTICGPGVIDGNGLRSWQAFWRRREWNPACTNKDEQRPRLIYISNSSGVTLSDITLQNAHFWTSHLYRCDHVRYLGCRILSPTGPVRAPSTDAIDLDVCTDVLIRDCYMSVNDDAVVVKGGKGPWADQAPENGGSERILIEDCRFVRSHGCLTVGSEAIFCRNLLMRRCKAVDTLSLLWLKLRPDTPQRYTWIAVEDVQGQGVGTFLNIFKWTQFFDAKGRTDLPAPEVSHLALRRCQVTCDQRCVLSAEQVQLSDFTFELLDIRAGEPDAPEAARLFEV